jgi:hypothetical protein
MTAESPRRAEEVRHSAHKQLLSGNREIATSPFCGAEMSAAGHSRRYDRAPITSVVPRYSGLSEPFEAQSAVRLE